MDIKLLDEAIKSRGVKKKWLATELGISTVSLCNKLKGRYEFTAKEMRLVKEALNLTPVDTIKIFLS